MNFTDEILGLVVHTLTGFMGDTVSMKGGILVAMIKIKKKLARRVINIEFLVVDLRASYNMVLGCPSLHRLRSYLSIYYLVIKFLTDHGTRESQGDQRISRCYNIELGRVLGTLDPKEGEETTKKKGKVLVQSIILEDLRDDSDPEKGAPHQGTPVKGLIWIPLSEDQPKRTFQIGITM
ncbi:hypothetical protein NE237_012691 [Protea cynaroides]|uniref:Uncharacterized protein n=1 Tax=Protea cynaroides TaxID=273540 RepID=A0A9Q0JZG5_9MAGN|nr:hypothetical protein NE237_012691 [Protea cynaroides]